MAALCFALSLISFQNAIKSQTFQGAATIIGDNSLDITLDYDTNLATLILNGRAGVWNGFGFGRSVMQNTYAIIMEYTRNDLSSTLLWEYTLANHKAGSRVQSDDITVLSDSTTANTRTVIIQRPIIGTAYQFPTASADATSLPLTVMSAIGSISSDYATSRNAAHSSSNRAAISMTLNKITTKPPTLVPTTKPSANPLELASVTIVPSVLPTIISDAGTEIIQCRDCASQTIQCTANKPCSIQCLSEKSCYNTTLRCNAHFACSIEAFNAYALSGSRIEGPISHDLDIKCLNVLSCANAVIDASNALSVHLHCDAMKSCEDFELFCPPHTNANKHCKVIGNTIDANYDTFTVQNAMMIHAVNGWNDIDLSLYTPTVSGSDANNIMFCGVDQCNIMHSNGAWDCIQSHSLCATNPQASTTTTTTAAAPTSTTTTTASTSSTHGTGGAQCPKGDILTGAATTGSVDVIGTINCIENTITLDIAYKEYNGEWFGLVFNTVMLGDALIFTTGKNSDRTASLYAYDITAKRLDNVVYQPTQDWTQLSMVLDFGSSGIRIVYQQNLDQTNWNTETDIIEFNIAIGSSLQLRHHTLRTTSTFALNMAPIPTAAPTKAPTVNPTTSVPTVIPTANPTTSTTTTTTIRPTAMPTEAVTAALTTAAVADTTCPNGEISIGNIVTADLNVKATFNCMEESITMDITYVGYHDNWFGLVFADAMFGSAIVYGAHPSKEAMVGLYSYDIQSKSSKGVIYRDGSDWMEEWTQYDHGIGSIRIVYSQALVNTDWNKETTQIRFRYAFGSALDIAYHSFRSDETFIMDLAEVSPTTRTPATNTGIFVASTTSVQPVSTSTRATIRCDEENDCSETIVQCTSATINDANACVIECASAHSCSNTLFECLDGSDCDVSCMGDGSCTQSTIQCGSSANCVVRGTGVNSLHHISINGQFMGGSLRIECDAEGTCYGALIAGLYSERLEVICGAIASCNEAKIQCPSKTASCQITATTTTEYDDANAIGMSIFAENSWLDIDETASYLPSGVALDMFCGIKYDQNCVGSEWNCNNKASLCYMDKEAHMKDIEIIRCDAHESPCVNRTISCETDKCRMICDGLGSCSGSNIACNNASDICEIICAGEDACSDVSAIECGMSRECNVECIGDAACSNTKIECGDRNFFINESISTAEDNVCVCNINGIDEGSLLGANIECLTNTNCSIACEAQGTCDGVTFYGRDSNFMDIWCRNASCDNIEVFCPSTSGSDYANGDKKCIMSGYGGRVESNALQVTIYAENSWNDIDLSNYVGVMVSNESRMICGASYADECLISIAAADDDWKCIDAHHESLCYLSDYDDDEYKATADASYSTTGVFGDETVLKLNANELTRSEYTAIIVVISFVVIIILLLAVYCFCYRPNQSIMPKNKYKSVKTRNGTHEDDDYAEDTMPIARGKENDKKQAIVEMNANMEQFAANI